MFNKASANIAKALADIAKVLANIVESQAENNRLVEKGHTQERFKMGMEHLGHGNASIRIFAFYEFVHLIKNNGEEYRKCILDILYAHIRTTTIDFENSEDAKNAQTEGEPIKPTEEIQRLLDILFKSQEIDHSDIKPNLQKIYFAGVDLVDGNLFGANLRRANLHKANLSGANLSEVDLSLADLSGADLSNADLSLADLPGADLSGADLTGARLFEADLSVVDLSDADLSDADLSGADLSNACLLGIDSPKVQLGGVFYSNKTEFPEWIVPPIAAPDNGDIVRFPEKFVALETY